MWRNLPENIALRWDNADRVFAGLGMIACSVMAILGGIGCMLEDRAIERGFPPSDVFSPGLVDGLFATIALGWLAIGVISALYVSSSRLKEWWPVVLVIYFAFSAMGFYCFGHGMAIFFVRSPFYSAM
ncbi:MAG: hypothetical protein AAGI54_03500 [Planctomycetota bacterium]